MIRVLLHVGAEPPREIVLSRVPCSGEAVRVGNRIYRVGSVVHIARRPPFDATEGLAANQLTAAVFLSRDHGLQSLLPDVPPEGV